MHKVCKFELALAIAGNLLDTLVVEAAANAGRIMENDQAAGMMAMANASAIAAGRDALFAVLLAHQVEAHNVGQEDGPSHEEYHKPLVARMTAIMDRLNTDISSDPPPQPPIPPVAPETPPQLPN